jgi:hypothetical protein
MLAGSQLLGGEEFGRMCGYFNGKKATNTE